MATTTPTTKNPSSSERKYIIPLRKEFNKVPGYKKSSKAVKAIRKFLAKHMKVKEVKISKEINLEIWKNGRKNPPAKIEVKVIKEEDYARAQLPELAYEKKIIKKKTEPRKAGLAGKLQEKVEELKSSPKEEKVTKEEAPKKAEEKVTEKAKPKTTAKPAKAEPKPSK